MPQQDRVDVWLNRALELENRGHDFYDGLAREAADPMAADFFKHLAAQELVHIEIIKKIRARLGDDSCWLAGGEAKPEGEALNQLFLKMIKNKPAPREDLIRAIDHGIVFETEAQAFYERQIPRASCEAEKKFLITLAAEENQHRLALADLKFYYTDPEGWADQVEHGLLDGA